MISRGGNTGLKHINKQNLIFLYSGYIQTQINCSVDICGFFCLISRIFCVFKKNRILESMSKFLEYVFLGVTFLKWLYFHHFLF